MHLSAHLLASFREESFFDLAFPFPFHFVFLFRFFSDVNDFGSASSCTSEASVDCCCCGGGGGGSDGVGDPSKPAKPATPSLMIPVVALV